MAEELIILLADQDANAVALLKRAFLRIGINAPVHASPDGEDVLDYLRGKAGYEDRGAFPFPRVLIMELDLPKRSGFEVLEWLEAHPECNVIPTIVLSSSSDPADVTKAYQLGANCYFEKTADLEELSEMVELAANFWTRALVPPLPPNC